MFSLAVLYEKFKFTKYGGENYLDLLPSSC